jgi:EAL domain-containing protein (putative c-di-GMP-specific phosphodiesterase class I)
VVAEGVETQGQLHVLESLDCDRMQGFLLAPSTDASVVEELVMAGTAPSLRRRGE